MKSDELERRINALEKDLAGQAGTIEQRRMKIREEAQGVRVGARKDLDRFVADVTRQLPHVIESAKTGELKAHLPAFIEETFRTFKVRRDPQCPACGPDAGEIVIAEYDELCMPHAH